MKFLHWFMIITGWVLVLWIVFRPKKGKTRKFDAVRFPGDK